MNCLCVHKKKVFDSIFLVKTNPPSVKAGYGRNFTQRACGAMDNASAYGAEDSRFESWHAQTFI